MRRLGLRGRCMEICIKWILKQINNILEHRRTNIEYTMWKRWEANTDFLCWFWPLFLVFRLKSLLQLHVMKALSHFFFLFFFVHFFFKFHFRRAPFIGQSSFVLTLNSLSLRTFFYVHLFSLVCAFFFWFFHIFLVYEISSCFSPPSLSLSFCILLSSSFSYTWFLYKPPFLSIFFLLL